LIRAHKITKKYLMVLLAPLTVESIRAPTQIT